MTADIVITADWLTRKFGEERGLQTALADAIGLDRIKVNKMAKGTRRITQEEANSIRQFFQDRGEDIDPGDRTTSYGNGLPHDARRSVDAIVRAFDPNLRLLPVSSRDRRLLEEAIELFTRLHGPDRPEDVERLVSLLQSTQQPAHAERTAET